MVNNDERYIALEQYKIYCEMKENFVNRSFSTNKFYIITIIFLFVITYMTRDVYFEFNISAIVINSLIGMGLSIFWWANVDAYDTIIKIKFKNVIDELEKHLPSQPHSLEKEGFIELRKAKKGYMFSDMQKMLALTVFIIFMVLFFTETVPNVAKTLHLGQL
jgi:hypothetical protein